nr:hypothetical protein [Bradyrhizobium prioritasuperba]
MITTPVTPSNLREGSHRLLSAKKHRKLARSDNWGVSPMRKKLISACLEVPDDNALNVGHSERRIRAYFDRIVRFRLPTIDNCVRKTHGLIRD